MNRYGRQTRTAGTPWEIEYSSTARHPALHRKARTQAVKGKSESEARRLVERSSVRGQQIQLRSKVAEAPVYGGAGELMRGGNEDQAVELRVDEIVGRIKPALPAVGHAALGSVSEVVLVAGTRTGGRRTRARLSARAYCGPPHAGCEQSGNGQDGQQSARNAHGFCLLRIAEWTEGLQSSMLPRRLILADSRRVDWRPGIENVGRGASNLMSGNGPCKVPAC